MCLNKNIKSFLGILMCGILAFLPVSCSDDSPVTGSPLLPEAPEGKVNVFLSLHKGSDYESPATRSGTAADETIMGPPWVLVFLGNDKDATFLEAVQANMTSAGELYAQLSACNSSVVLLLISNADELIQVKLGSLTTTTTLSDAVTNLLLYGDPSDSPVAGNSALAIPQATVPFTGKKIPMSAYCPLPQIITGTTVGTVGTPLRLKRIVSKLYVDASGAHASDGFILTGVSVINVPVQGALAFEYGNVNETLPITAQFTDYGHKSGSASRLDNPIIASSTGFAGHITAGMGSEDYPVYVYETAGGPADRSDVILAGKFDNGPVRYYRASLKNSKGEKLAFKRNYLYTLNLVRVEGGGYSTMDEAIAAPSGSSGILCNVTVVDDSHEITGNGVYYLGLTNSSYVLYTDEEQKDVTVCVIGTNAYSRPGSTVTPGVVSMSSGIAGVTLKTTSISADSTAIKLDFAKGAQGETTLDVQVGGLRREIKLKAAGMGVSGNYASGSQGLLLGDFNQIRILESTSKSGLAISPASPDRDSEVISSVTSPSVPVYFFVEEAAGPQSAKLSGLAGESVVVIENRVYNDLPAASNIYWDAAQGRLTFDDVPSYVPAARNQKQGVYFLYGSLIALQGGSSATDVRQLDAAEVNPVWKTNQSPNIPKFNPASLAPGADLENVLTHIHNPGNRIGDICRYLTQRGWAPPGKKWKMPVKVRLEAVLNSIYRTEGSWLPIGGLATDGTGEVVHGRLIKDRFYFPASGSRKEDGTFIEQPGVSGHYWSSSVISGSIGWQPASLWFQGGDAAIQATALDVALPVRCVVDNTSTDWPELATVAYYASPPGGATLTSELPANHFVEQRKPFALPSTPLTFSDPSVTHTGWGNNLGLGENTTINTSVGSFHATFSQGASLEYDSNLPAGTALVSGTVPGVYVAAGGTSIKLSTNQLVCSNPGYVHTGWSIDGVYHGLGANYVMHASGSRKAFAVWSRDCWVEYLAKAPAGAPAGVTVTGTLPSPVKVAQNSSVTLATEAQGLQVCSDPRWKHTAWTAGAFGGNTIVTNDLKIYPEWTRYYQVTYSPQPPSGTVPGYPRSEIVAPGSSVMLPVQLHSSDPLQVHQAWLVGGQEKAPGTSVIVNGDMTITAKWLLYEVSYLANAPVGTTSVTPLSALQKIAPGKMVTLSATRLVCSDPAWIHTGWSVGGVHYILGANIPVLSNMQVSAEWTKRFKIKYHLNLPSGTGHAGDMLPEDEYVMPGQNVTLAVPRLKCSNEDFFFTGWMINGQFYGLGSSYTPLPGQDTDVYAVWKYAQAMEFNVTVSNSGRGTDNATLVFTDSKEETGAFFQSRGVVAWSNTGSPVTWFDPVSTGRTWSSNWMAFASEELHTYANLRNGGGDPCRLIGYSQKYVSTQISKGELPDNRTWRLPKGREYMQYGFTPENKVGSWANGWNFNNGKFLPASGMRSVADGQLRESGVGYYWLSDYFTIIDDFGKQYMGRGSKVSSEKVIEEGVVYHSAAGFQIRCVRQ